MIHQRGKPSYTAKRHGGRTIGAARTKQETSKNQAETKIKKAALSAAKPQKQLNRCCFNEDRDHDAAAQFYFPMNFLHNRMDIFNIELL
ncbi:MAG: hypothetical protein ACK5NY_08495 [Burkholderiaceae bacterium]